MKHEFRIYQSCPTPKLIVPYIAICCQDAYKGDRYASLLSTYRGRDARTLLAKYGKLDQEELWRRFQRGVGAPANPPGTSTHEQKLGGAYPGPKNRDGAWWQLGFDINDPDSEAVIRAARSHGWELFRPYPGGAEHHHLNFRKQPRPGPRTLARILWLRANLPRS